MNFLKRALVASAMSVLATSAWAASYTFDLEHPSYGGDAASASSANSFSITHGDMVGTFTGRYIEDPGYDGDMKLTNPNDDFEYALQLRRWQLGAGIYNVSTNDQHTVDGKVNHDFVEMAFSFLGDAVDVTLSSLSFGYIATGYSGVNSAFELILDTTGNATINLGDMRVFEGDAESLVDLSGLGLVGDVFGVLAGENGSWKLKAVTVGYSVPEVPLPAAVWLMLGGLGGLVTVGKRRQNAT